MCPIFMDETCRLMTGQGPCCIIREMPKHILSFLFGFPAFPKITVLIDGVQRLAASILRHDREGRWHLTVWYTYLYSVCLHDDISPSHSTVSLVLHSRVYGFSLLRD